MLHTFTKKSQEKSVREGKRQFHGFSDTIFNIFPTITGASPKGGSVLLGCFEARDCCPVCPQSIGLIVGKKLDSFCQ